jgi:hypothetical protein
VTFDKGRPRCPPLTLFCMILDIGYDLIGYTWLNVVMSVTESMCCILRSSIGRRLGILFLNNILTSASVRDIADNIS